MALLGHFPAATSIPTRSVGAAPERGCVRSTTRSTSEHAALIPLLNLPQCEARRRSSVVTLFGCIISRNISAEGFSVRNVPPLESAIIGRLAGAGDIRRGHFYGCHFCLDARIGGGLAGS